MKPFRRRSYVRSGPATSRPAPHPSRFGNRAPSRCHRVRIVLIVLAQSTGRRSSSKHPFGNRNSSRVIAAIFFKYLFEFIETKRLYEVLVTPCFAGECGKDCSSVAADKDNRHITDICRTAYLPGSVKPAHARQVAVHQDQVGARALSSPDSFLSIGCFDDAVTATLDHGAIQQTRVLVVVRDQDKRPLRRITRLCCFGWVNQRKRPDFRKYSFLTTAQAELLGRCDAVIRTIPMKYGQNASTPRKHKGENSADVIFCFGGQRFSDPATSPGRRRNARGRCDS